MFAREKKYRWIKIANDITELRFGDSNIAEVEIEGNKICIARTISGVKACSSRCPHAGGDMSQGKLDKKGNIVCPVHGYIFNLNNGRDSNFEGYFLKIYPIMEGNEGVFVGIEELVFAD